MVWRFDDGAGVMVKRYDSGTLGQVQQTPQGGIRVPSFPTRAGVFPYRQPDGSIRLEYRPPEEVFSAESLASLANAPITDLHPEQYGLRIPVTPDNWRSLAVGHVGPDARQDGDHVAADLLIQDQGMITMVLAKERVELSCGYDCKVHQTPGITPDGQRYDAVQRGIVYNHVAVGPVGWGRAGPTVALRADSGDAEQVPKEREDSVEKETINGVEYIVGSKEHLAALRGQRDTAQGRADAADKALDAAKKAAPVVDQVAVNKAARVRANLLVICDRAAVSKRVTFDAAAAEPLTNDALVVQAIKILDPSAEVEGKSPEYLAGVLDTLARTMKAESEETAPENKTSTDPAAPTVPVAGPRTDSPLFKAREGQKPIKTDAAKEAEKEEASRYDSDLAEKDLLAKNRTRGTKPLEITKATKA